MTRYVMQSLGVDEPEANRLRAQYWRDHGTTLAGLMRLHGVDPGPYLHEVHEISLDHLVPDPALAARIERLPGQRIVYTNGSEPYARRVLAARGLGHLFEEVYGVEHADFHPKPDRAAFDRVFGRAGIVTDRAAMFEDDPRNLAVPHALGMQTVLVADAPHAADHIHHHTDDLTGFLDRVL